MWGDKDTQTQKLIDKIEELSRQVASLEGKLKDGRERLGLADDLVGLKKQIADLEIERDKKKEEHDRREREVRHEVGLLRKQVETEQQLSTQEAKLEVREENLSADRERFEEQMKFTTQRFEQETTYLREIMAEIMKRLPTVEVNKTLDFGHNGNGNGEKAAVE